jgi:hypothetical protein
MSEGMEGGGDGAWSGRREQEKTHSRKKKNVNEICKKKKTSTFAFFVKLWDLCLYKNSK